jgi:outer membrane receptor protein involved in Fe transport
MKRILGLLSILFLLPAGAFAAGLKGKIIEQQTGEAAVGAIVVIDDRSDLNDVAGLDGSFHIHNIPDGEHTVKVLYTGARTHVQKLTLTGIVTLDIELISDQKKELDEVKVSSRKDGAAEHTARGIERNAPQVMNVVSGKAIQLSPDLTVANVIQRVSGISLERNSNGDGQFAILRGMDKRYNYTLVNGVKIPSPDNKYRYVPLDIFPADLLDRLEVYKALTPEMEGDAVGGAINMVMKDAPSGLTATANVAGGYNELFTERDFASYDFRSIQKKSPYELNGSAYNATMNDLSKAATNYRYKRPNPNLIAGLAIGNRFFKDRLGILLAGSYQNTYRGSNSIFYDIDKVDTFKGATLTKYSKREYSEQQTRSGLHLKSDFRINQRHKLQWYNAYLSLNNVQVRDVTAMQLTIGGYDSDKGNATMNYATRTRLTTQHIFNSTLQGEHFLSSRLKLSWSAVYSKATQETPDNTTVPLLGTLTDHVAQKTYVQDGTRRWEHNSDRDLAGYLQLSYSHHIHKIPVKWTTGGLYRDKDRVNFYNQYQLRPTNLTAQYGKDFNSYADIEWTIQNPRGSVASALNYGAKEKITAGFLQFQLMPKNLDITGGVRLENTNQSYAMQFPVGEDRPADKQVYLDVLPSLHFKYMPNRTTNIRASYFRSVNRPGFFEIVPYKIVNEEYQERGNPDLKRAIADNIDVRYEWYPSQGEQLMAGVFYKSIQNPIEYTLQRDPVRGQDIYNAPGNFGTARNYGIELDAIKYLKKWGIKANYTYTHSAITTTKSKRIRNSAGNLETISVDQTRPLYGQAAHIANLSLLFKDARHGWDVQLAGNYTGERIITVSQFVDNDFWQKAFVQLDFSLEKTIVKKWAVFAKVNNILNTPMEVSMKQAYNNTDAIPEQTPGSETLIRRDYYQRAYLLGLRWKL